jgi:hypothetical protein
MSDHDIESLNVRYDTQHNSIQYNDTRRNDTQHKGLNCDIRENDALLFVDIKFDYAKCHHTGCRYTDSHSAILSGLLTYLRLFMFRLKLQLAQPLGLNYKTYYCGN